MSVWETKLEKGVLTATYSFPPMNYIGADGTRQMVAADRIVGIPRDSRHRHQGRAFRGNSSPITTARNSRRSIPRSIENCRTLGVSPIPGYNAMLRRLQRLPKPVIAAMNGDAMGGGFEFCLACDIRIGEPGDYRYGLPETKLGLIPGGGGTQRLSRLIGVAKAMEFILRGPGRGPGNRAEPRDRQRAGGGRRPAGRGDRIGTGGHAGDRAGAGQENDL